MIAEAKKSTMDTVIELISKNVRNGERRTREAQGVSAKVFSELNGKKYMIKGESNSESIAEIFCYRLAKKLDLNVFNTFYLENKGFFKKDELKIVSVHQWNEDFKILDSDDYEIYSDFERKRESLKKKFKHEIMRMRMFDVIVSNEDRHIGNWGFVGDFEEIGLIDHGLCKPWKCNESRIEDDLTETNYEFNYSRKKDELAVRDFCRDFCELKTTDFYEMIVDLIKYDRTRCLDILNRMCVLQYKFSKDMGF